MESYDEDSDVHQQIYSIYAITIYIYTYIPSGYLTQLLNITIFNS